MILASFKQALRFQLTTFYLEFSLIKHLQLILRHQFIETLRKIADLINLDFGLNDSITQHVNRQCK